MSLVDQKNEPANLDQLRADLTEATKNLTAEKPASTEGAAPAEQEEAPAVPDKYRGKSVEDVIDMHRNAESALGRTANELGQYKKLTDELLELKRPDDLRKGGASEAEIEAADLPAVSSTDLLDNPADEIARVVDARLTSEAQKREQMELEEARKAQASDFATKHPDAQEVAGTQQFRDWVTESPLRRRAALEAYRGDFTAGTELLDEYKASMAKAPTQEPETVADKVAVTEDPNIEEARKASTVSTGSSQTGDGPKGKTYRRLDLIRLKLEDPEAYSQPAFQQEIMAAYREGRVK